ncbi:hypothetical protein [Bacillus cereus]|uniref:hypothetical protein n=1 Tax=Bacillus cereus TaxID=1396 RepID=UPI00211D74B3|nr:hypothetical protein [Bacillus cereus]
MSKTILFETSINNKSNNSVLRYHFNLTIDNESVPSKYRLVTSISFEIYEEFGIVPYDFSSKEATLQIAIDTASAIAKKYCEKPVTQ